jgi:peptidoglycan/xylan/chitin deacetylase (PgdA/CDA1 family)
MRSAPAAIALTLDYELFLKESGSLEQTLIRPTERLLDLGKRLGHSYTFFVDATYLLALRRDPAYGAEFELAASQVRRMVEEGHRVELHLHPSWLDAVRSGAQWLFPSFSRYSLHSLNDSQIADLVSSGASMLNELAGSVQPGYAVEAFRAGGWCIQPFGRLKDFLLRNGISVDSTVAPGCYTLGSPVQYFDFRDAPRGKAYRFEDDPLVEVADGRFVEVPISTYPKGRLRQIARRANRKVIGKRERILHGDGIGMGLADIYPGGSPPDRSEGLEMATVQAAIAAADAAFYWSRGDRRMNMLAHPKNFNDQSYRLIRYLSALGFRFVHLKEYIGDAR